MLEYHLELPDDFDKELLDALHVLGEGLFQERTKPVSDGSETKKKKKQNESPDSVNELLSEQVRAIAPILPRTTLEQVTEKLYGHVARLF